MEKIIDFIKLYKNQVIKEEANNIFTYENEYKKASDFKIILEKFKKQDKELIEKFERENKNFNDKLEEISKENKELITKVNSIKTKLHSIKEKNKKIFEILGHIQLKDKAKNLLRSFNIILNEKDKKIIEKNEKKKWELISEKIKEKYKSYENTNNYKVFCEIIEKSAETIEKVNEYTPNIKLNFYEKNIDKFIKDNKVEIINPMKMNFLMQINVSEKFLLSGYNFLESYFQNSMIEEIAREKTIDEFFK